MYLSNISLRAQTCGQFTPVSSVEGTAVVAWLSHLELIYRYSIFAFTAPVHGEKMEDTEIQKPRGETPSLLVFGGDFATLILFLSNWLSCLSPLENSSD